MTQSATLAAMDALFASTFARTGLADTVTHQPPSPAAAIQRPALVDRAVEYVGGDMQVRSDMMLVTVWKAHGVAPRSRDTITIAAETWRVDRVEREDESRVVCSVVRD